MDFEQKMQKLEQIVEQMEKGDLSLDKALGFFEEGVKLSKDCAAELDQAEQRVKLLLGLDAQGEPITEDFISEKE